MHKTFIFIVLLLVSISGMSFAAEASLPIQEVPCSPELKPHLSRILEINEARECFKEAQKEGAVSVVLSDHPLCRQFGALWDVEERCILINLEAHKTFGSVIGSILFEMQNAVADSKFAKVERMAREGRLSKEAFVQGMERIEYENSLNAANIARIGIKRGLFPKDAELFTYSSFEEYYHYQGVGHHKDVYEEGFDRITSYSSFP